MALFKCLLQIQQPTPPVRDILTIEIDSGPPNKSSNSPTFDVRLFNKQGILQRQQTTHGGTVQFNVSNLPADTYFLHIKEGTNTEIHQIIVE